MRAHITKTNFAKRRQHAPSTGEKPRGQRKDQSPWLRASKNPESNHTITLLSPIPTVPDLARETTAFHRIQELVFLEGRHSPGNANEAAWFNLVASYPVLTEATMAVAVRHWSPDDAWQLKAYRHSYAAVHLIKHRIMSTGAQKEGVLGAVIVLAFGATLERDDMAWNIHIIGLAHMIKDRKSRAMNAPPPWMIDLIVQLVSLYHERILEALIDYDDQRILGIKRICDSVIQLQKTIESHHQHRLDPTVVAREIEEPLSQLHYDVRDLRDVDDVYVQAIARAIELVLYLLWPSWSGAYLTLLAGELKEAISRLPLKGCSYMNLTSFPLMIGAIAAEEDSLARMWFVDSHPYGVGGNETLPKSLAAVRVNGIVLAIGQVGESTVDDVFMFAALLHTCIVRGILAGSRNQFRELVRFIDDHKIVPAVDDVVFELTEAKSAYRRLAEKKHFAKVLIKID
ncbi:Polyketide synthase enoylreductase [Penicillium robsamsonii]|uniref:Polyketide synthase enoylreductase n=1 Tax=Penicillium robsamsonii TaxID=1792511 RepID=UPI00254780CC|nr:Polyketide synthase enoylreductase [Penicillium robsamsonii]KAJ5827157.1 Polyketide synthase enoylreductase [Penicillium robsamsonii]